MDIAGEALLACARLAADQDGGTGLGRSPCQLEYLQALVRDGDQVRDLLAQAQATLDGFQQLLGTEGFDNVVDRAGTHGFGGQIGLVFVDQNNRINTGKRFQYSGASFRHGIHVK